MTLYELTAEFQELLDMAQEGDLDAEVLADTLDAVGGEIEVKAESYAKIIQQLKGDSEALAQESARLDAKRASIDNNIKRMKAALQGAMQITGKTKFKTQLFSFNIQNNAPSLVVDVPVDKIPNKYLVFPDPTINKTLLRQDMKAGEDLSGLAHFEQSASLRIR